MDQPYLGMMSAMDDERPELDYRFSLANERTFLAWVRTSIALIAGGVVAAKALNFHHDAWRWVLAVPPIIGGALLALDATVRWRTYEREMRAGLPLSAGRGLRLIGALIFVYAVLVLVAAIADG